MAYKKLLLKQDFPNHDLNFLQVNIKTLHYLNQWSNLICQRTCIWFWCTWFVLDSVRCTLRALLYPVLSSISCPQMKNIGRIRTNSTFRNNFTFTVAIVSSPLSPKAFIFEKITGAQLDALYLFSGV